jgi:diguanylate cyclase (GGDEF)-like protein
MLYQPLIAAHSRAVHGVEALVRWQHPKRGFLGPDSFLPAMERNNLMAGLTVWTVEQAARTCAWWRQEGYVVPISVNLSATLLHDEGLVQRVVQILHRYELPAAMLTLEVTETALAQQPAAAASIFDRLRASGIHVSVDDFGTGYTSLAMLKDYIFDEIKIDRSFIAAMRHSPADAAIVRSILELGHRLGLTVVAEGIEDGGTARLLEELECDVLQGFYFAKPCTAADALDVIRNRGTGTDRCPPLESAYRVVGPRSESGAVPAPVLADEDERLAALRSLHVLDTAPEQVLDDLVAIAAKICGTPTALLSLIDRDRQWFKARVGMKVQETPREMAFCAHAILQPDQVMEVSDTLRDERFATNPLVTGDPHIRFYAGAPLVTDEGQAIGTLCVLDSVRHTLDDDQRETLQKLSRMAMSYLQVSRSDALMHRLRDVSRTLAKMHAVNDIPDAASAVAVAAREILHADGATLMIADHPGAVHYRPAGIATPHAQDAAELVQVVVDSRTDSAVATVVQNRQPLFIADADASGLIAADLIEQFQLATAFYLPLLHETAVAGVLVIWWRTGQEVLSQPSIVAASILADEASSTLARLDALAALRHAAETDPLTGLLNRRAFTAGLTRLPPDSAIVMLDLDHFKRINDQDGHQAGDQVLKSFSAHLRAAARSEDLVARWGGEEFVIALPGGTAEGAQSLLTRVRESWAGAPVTFSAGYTIINPRETATTAMERADTALYQAKTAGRNQDTYAPAITTA